MWEEKERKGAKKNNDLWWRFENELKTPDIKKANREALNHQKEKGCLSLSVHVGMVGFLLLLCGAIFRYIRNRIKELTHQTFRKANNFKSIQQPNYVTTLMTPLIISTELKRCTGNNNKSQNNAFKFLKTREKTALKQIEEEKERENTYPLRIWYVLTRVATLAPSWFYKQKQNSRGKNL